MNKLALAVIAGLVTILACFIVSGEIVSGVDGDGSQTENTLTSDVTVKQFSGTLMIGGVEKSYTSFDDAIEDAIKAEDKTIKFMSDSTFSKPSKNDGDDWAAYDVSGLTLNLNNTTVEIANHMALILVGNKDFKVCNGSINVVKKSDGTYLSYALFIGADPTGSPPERYVQVTLEDLNLSGGLNAWEYYDVAVDGLNIVGTKYYSLWYENGARLFVNDGEYESDSTSVNRNLGFETTKGSQMTIYGGEFKVKDGQELILKGTSYGTPKIIGGFFYGVDENTNEALATELNNNLEDKGYTISGSKVSGYEVVPKEAVASVTVGGKTTEYASLSDAVAVAQSSPGKNVTVTLLDDIVTAESFSFYKDGDYTFDIGNQKITFTGSGYLLAVGGSSKQKYPIDTINPNAKLTILGTGTIDASGGTVFRSYSQMVFGANGVGPTVTYSSTDYKHTILKVEEGSSLIVNGGKFSLKDSNDNKVTRVMQSYGTTTINGGTFGGEIQIWSYSNYLSKMTINGGTVPTLLICDQYGSESSSVVIKACEIRNPKGQFSRVIGTDNQVTYGMTLDSSNGDCKVIFTDTDGGKKFEEQMKGSFVATMGSDSKTYYVSLEGAVSDASSGATINVLKSVGCVKDKKNLKFQGASLIHTYVVDKAVSPTCTADGLKEGSHCSVCGYVQVAQEKDPATGHTWDTGTVTQKATCNTEGSKVFKCTKCGETKTETISVTGNHVWNSGTVTKNPTCSDDGEKTFTCSNCGTTKTETIAATGNHTWDSGKVIKEPTTTESGTTEYTCSVCGKTKTATIEPKKVEVVVEDKVTTTTETQKTVEKSDDGTQTVTEAKTVSKEENGRVVEKVETTKSTTTSTTESGSTTTVSETKVTEKAGQATEKVETSTSTTKEDNTTIVSKSETVEKGNQKVETVEVKITSDDETVETSVSVSDGTTSGVKTVITGEVTDDVIASAVKQVDMAAEAISEKVSDVSKDISVDTHEVTLSPAALSAIASSGASLTITGDAGSIGIDSGVTSTMTSREEDVTISINEKKDGLTDAQKQKAGENKVIELSAKTATQDIHELGGTAKVMIDMTGMEYKSPAVYWLKDDGTSVKVDAEFGEGYAMIELSHFSLYYIAETASSSTFIIIPDTSDDDFPGYIPTPSSDAMDSGSGDTAKIAALLGAIVVLLVAMVALTHKGR